MGRLSNPDHLYCRALTVFGLDSFLAAHDIESAPLLEEQGMGPGISLEADSFLPWNAVCTLFESAARKPGLERFGLLLSASLTPDRRQLGPLIHLACLSKSGREYIRLSTRYQLTHKGGLTYRVSEDLARGVVSWRTAPHPRSVYCRQMVEYTISNNYRSVGQFLSIGGVQEIHFTYDAPDDTEIYEQIFDCPVIFGAKYNQLIIRAAYLDEKLKAGHPILGEAVRDYLDHHSYRFSQIPHSLSQTVKAALPTLFGVNRTDMRSVASVYGMSQKKLQRLLSDEGTSFSVLRNDVRRSLAESLLSHTNIPIARLAIFLDYASSSAFHHACRRWFGVSPRAFRKGQVKEIAE